MRYEKCEIITMIANVAIPADSVGRAITATRSGPTMDARAALASAATSSIVGVLAQDGPFVAGESVPVALLFGKLPVRVSAAVQAGTIAILHSDGTFRSGAALANIPDNGMAAGVYTEDAAANGIPVIHALPLFKSG